jgi:hypothetical protein
MGQKKKQQQKQKCLFLTKISIASFVSCHAVLNQAIIHPVVRDESAVRFFTLLPPRYPDAKDREAALDR